MRSLVGQYSFMVLRGAAMTNRPQVSLSSFVMVIILFVSGKFSLDKYVE